MRIAYLAGYSSGSGVHNKINAQIAAWKDEGHQVELFQLNSPTRSLNGVFGQISYYLNYLVRARKIAKRLAESSPDIVYCRYFLYSPHLKSVAKKYCSVIEVNSDDRVEFNKKSAPVRILNKITRNGIYRAFSGIVSMTEELRDRIKFSGKPSVCIPNGVPDSDIIGVARNYDGPLSVGFIASPGAFWHGIEDVIGFAKLHPEIEFHMIGQEPFKILPNVKYAGVLIHSEASRVLSQCDAAISTLGLHKKEMKEACPLKSRHYLALGLPTIIGYNDPDISDQLPFVFRVPNCSGGILENHEHVAQFIKSARKDQTLSSQATQFAKENLTVFRKEKRRLEFFENLINNNN